MSSGAARLALAGSGGIEGRGMGAGFAAEGLEQELVRLGVDLFYVSR